MKLLIFGSSGFVGSDLFRACLDSGMHVVGVSRRVEPVPASTHVMDVASADREAFSELLAKHRPDAIAYCAVAGTRDPETMQREVNSNAISRLIAACRNTGNPKLVYLSTDAVFGDTAGPHGEADTPEPETRRDDLVDYARTKAEGERHVLSYEEGIVARTSQVNGVGPNGELSRRLNAVLEKLRNGEPLARFSDMRITDVEK